MMFITEKLNRLDLFFDGDIFLSGLKSLFVGAVFQLYERKMGILLVFVCFVVVFNLIIYDFHIDLL